MSAKTVAILGTLDTKGEEFQFLRRRIEAEGLAALVVDAGVLGEPFFMADIRREEVAHAAGRELADLQSRRDRGESVEAMAVGAAAIIRKLFEAGKIHGVISLGGSAGTTVGTAAMRVLPVGVPKVMVSTLASGQTRPYVGTKDIAMLYSVVDISGLNRVSARVLANAAAAIAGMVKQSEVARGEEKPLVAATMFGVTTPCVTEVRWMLEQRGYEVVVFHATGTGGQAMESLIADGYLTGVLDITTTELADELVGGILSAGSERLEAAGRCSIPQVVCPGALDMVNFGPFDSVPEKFKSRRLYRHNPTVTLMRTTPDECAELARLIAKKLNQARGPVAFAMPLRGVSAIDAEGEPFYWPEANRAFLASLKTHLATHVRLVEVDAHINDARFAREVTRLYLEMTGAGQERLKAEG
jgi:uncharacterized protein (UPF0261 family)